MAKPAFIEKLRHGRALCGANFPRFVETFNWAASSLHNLIGDGNRNQEGNIVVDWEANDRPVIKLVGQKAASGGGAFNVVGTDGSTAVLGTGTATNTLTFATAEDSDVRVHVDGADGDVTVKIGVYWK